MRKLTTLDIVMLVALALVILASVVPALMVAPVAAIYGCGVIGASVVMLLLWFLLRSLLQ